MHWIRRRRLFFSVLQNTERKHYKSHIESPRTLLHQRNEPIQYKAGTHAICLLLLTLHKLLIMQHFFKFIIIPIISGLHYFLCTGKWSGLGSAVTSAYRRTTSPRLIGGFVITSLTHAGGFGVTLLACSIAAVGLGFSPRPSTMLRHHLIKPSSLLGHLGTGLGAGILSLHNLGLRYQHRAH